VYQRKLDTKSSRIEETEAKLGEVEAQLQQQQNSHQQQLGEVEAQLQQQQNSHQEQLEQQQKHYEKQLQQQKKKHQEKLEDADRHLQNTIHALNAARTNHTQTEHNLRQQNASLQSESKANAVVLRDYLQTNLQLQQKIDAMDKQLEDLQLVCDTQGQTAVESLQVQQAARLRVERESQQKIDQLQAKHERDLERITRESNLTCVKPGDSVYKINKLCEQVSGYMQARRYSTNQQQKVLTTLLKKMPADEIVSTEVTAETARKWSERHRDQFHTSTVRYLAGLSLKQLESIVPEAFQIACRADGVQACNSVLMQHWDYVTCANTKLNLYLSDRQWDHLRRSLFQSYNPIDGSYSHLTVCGEVIEKPLSSYLLSKWGTRIASEYDLEELLEGKATWLDMMKKMDADLQGDIDNGFFEWTDAQLRSKLNNGPVVVQFLFDAARTVRARQTTALGFKFANGSPLSHRPKHTHLIGCTEGGDDYENLLSACSPIFAKINELVANPVISVGGRQVPCVVVAGADQAAVHSNYSMMKCNHPFACPYCTCPSHLFGVETDSSKYTTRSIQHFRLLAHLVEGTCPGCKMEIVINVTDPATQMKIAQPGDPTPPVPKHCKGSWAMLHLGKRYALDVLIEIEPWFFALCILHMNLCFVAKLVKSTMLSSFTASSTDNETRAAALHQFFAENGVALKPPKATSDCSETYVESITKHSFAGADAAAVLLVWEGAMKKCWPAELTDDQPGKSSRTSRKTVAGYCELWRHYANKLWPTINDLQLSKPDKAAQVQAQAEVFARLWTDALGDNHQLYMHLLLCHLSQQILRLPVDTYYLQTQSLEHLNKIRKALAKLQSNCHKPGNQANVEVKGYTYKNFMGKMVNVGDHIRYTGPCMTYQLMKLHTIRDHVANVYAKSQGEREAARQMDKARKKQVDTKAAWRQKLETNLDNS
jgi:hypothetical protein